MRAVRRLGVVVGLVCALATACNLSEDKDAQRFPLNPQQEQALKRVSSTTTTPAQTKSEDLFYLSKTDDEGDEQLVRVQSQLKETRSSNDEALAVLEALKAVPSDRSDDLRSNLNPTSKINSVRIHDNIADVDLVLDVTGQPQRLAVAQIVFSLTELDDVNAVRFFVNNEASNPLGGPPGTPLVRDDFPRLKEAVDAAPSTTIAPAPGG